MALLRRTKVAQSDFFPGFTDIVEIGIGSLATVYRAREIGTNRNVALKLLNVRDASPRAIESFERESIALGAVSSHPNIVTLYRSFRAGDGRPVLVLELCSGSIGDRTIAGNGLPVPEVVSIGIKVAGALETAHRAEILHRDVKPQNILMTEFGEPALADFGVAMLQSSTQTTAGLFDFTTLHAAPELLEGGETSAATDVYELASSIYQLIAGRSAFRAYDGESPASVILRILRDPVQPLVNAQVPTQLSDLLIYAMSKDKDSRPPTAAEFAAELARIEVEQGWPRTQFLIRDPAAPGGSAGPPTITRMPMLRPRNAPPVGLAASAPRPGGATPFDAPTEVRGSTRYEGPVGYDRPTAFDAPAAYDRPAPPSPPPTAYEPAPPSLPPTPTTMPRIPPASFVPPAPVPPPPPSAPDVDEAPQWSTVTSHGADAVPSADRDDLTPEPPAQALPTVSTADAPPVEAAEPEAETLVDEVSAHDVPPVDEAEPEPATLADYPPTVHAPTEQALIEQALIEETLIEQALIEEAPTEEATAPEPAAAPEEIASEPYATFAPPEPVAETAWQPPALLPEAESVAPSAEPPPAASVEAEPVRIEPTDAEPVRKEPTDAEREDELENALEQTRLDDALWEDALSDDPGAPALPAAAAAAPPAGATELPPERRPSPSPWAPEATPPDRPLPAPPDLDDARGAPTPAEATVMRSSLRAPNLEPTLGALPEPSAPAEATVMRSSLGSPPADATVARSTFPGVPVAPGNGAVAPSGYGVAQPAARPYPGPGLPAQPSYQPQPQPQAQPAQPNPHGTQQTVFRSDLRAAQYPIPPAGGAGGTPGGPVPSWSARTPQPGPGVPQQHTDLTLDPMSLRRRVSIRSGMRALVIDEQKLVLRSWWSKSEIAWPDVLGFELRFEGAAASGSGGHLVAITRTGPVDLPATKRSMADLRYVQALLEAYRQRWRLMAN